MRKSIIAGALVLVSAGIASAQQQQGTSSNAAKIANAARGGPADISAAATIADVGADGKMIILRKGSNGWMCMPDNPVSPGPDPICADKTWQGWFEAYLAKKKPVVTQIGIAYMLMGGSDASNHDPFAEKPAAGDKWITTPAHLMIVLPDSRQLESYPGTVQPGAFIMFKGTPYAHLMLPVPKAP
jgi:hypothetical protein